MMWCYLLSELLQPPAVLSVTDVPVPSRVAPSAQQFHLLYQRPLLLPIVHSVFSPSTLVSSSCRLPFFDTQQLTISFYDHSPPKRYLSDRSATQVGSPSPQRTYTVRIAKMMKMFNMLIETVKRAQCGLPTARQEHVSKLKEITVLNSAMKQVTHLNVGMHPTIGTLARISVLSLNPLTSSECRCASVSEVLSWKNFTTELVIKQEAVSIRERSRSSLDAPVQT